MRVGGTLLPPMVVHGLWGFSLVSHAVDVDPKTSPGMLLPLALQVALIVLVTVKRRTIEPPAGPPDDTTLAPTAHRAAGHRHPDPDLDPAPDQSWQPAWLSRTTDGCEGSADVARRGPSVRLKHRLLIPQLTPGSSTVTQTVYMAVVTLSLRPDGLCPLLREAPPP